MIFRVAPALALLLLLPACQSTEAGAEETRPKDAIVVAGEWFPTGVRVITWDEPDSYNAYARRCHFRPDEVLPRRPATGCNTPERFSSRRLKGLDADLASRIEADGFDLETIRERVHQFVVHYDACGTSQRCFEVLQDVRGLSVHFMLDLDGTIYQTLDAIERARHAGRNNDVSVGVEIAHIGSYSDPARLAAWYAPDPEHGVRITLPESYGDGGQRHPERARYPARPDLIEGPVQHQHHYQYDYTEAQYRSLARLTAALHRAFPRIRLAAPRDAEGRVITHLLEEEQQMAFEGLVGHFHVSKVKTDPGPALDWDRVLAEARELVGSSELQ